jgi:hypothetical protein
MMDGKTQSTGEAMGVLENSYSDLLAKGREVAAQQCRRDGTTHTRKVRAEMEVRGFLRNDGSKEFWLGALFRDRRFEATGERFSYTDEGRNIHEREVKLWRLKA